MSDLQTWFPPDNKILLPTLKTTRRVSTVTRHVSTTLYVCGSRKPHRCTTKGVIGTHHLRPLTGVTGKKGRQSVTSSSVQNRHREVLSVQLSISGSTTINFHPWKSSTN